MALADELAYMTATELAARIRRRELSPVEVVDAFIERIEARNQSPGRTPTSCVPADHCMAASSSSRSRSKSIRSAAR